MNRLLLIIILFELLYIQSFAQNTKDLIHQHVQWIEKYTPKADDLSDEELLFRTACVIQGISREKCECDLIRACGKWDDSLLKFADFFEQKSLDICDQEKLKALLELESISNRVCGNNSLSTVHIRYIYASILFKYENLKASYIMKQILMDFKNPKSTETDDELEKYVYYLLYKVTDILMRLSICETPDIWKDVMEIEHDVLQFLSIHDIDSQVVADIYQYLGSIKGKSPSFPEAYSSAVNESLLGCDYIPDHDYCGDGCVSDSRYLYEKSLEVLAHLYGGNNISMSQCIYDYSIFLIDRGFGLSDEQVYNVLLYRDQLKEYLTPEFPEVLQFDVLSECFILEPNSFSKEWCHNIIKKYDVYYGALSEMSVSAMSIILTFKSRSNPDELNSLILEYEDKVAESFYDNSIKKLDYLSYTLAWKQILGVNIDDFVNNFVEQYKQYHKPQWESIVCGHDMFNILMFYTLHDADAIEIQEILVKDLRELVSSNDLQLAIELKDLADNYPDQRFSESIDCLNEAIKICENIGESPAALYYSLARKYNYARNREQALSNIDKAILCNPESEDYQILNYKLWKANVLMGGENGFEAIEGEKLFKEILPLFHQLKTSQNINFDTYLLVGDAFFYIGDMLSAVNAYEEGRSSYLEIGGSDCSIIGNFSKRIAETYSTHLNNYTLAINVLDEEINRLKDQNEQLFLLNIFDFIDLKLNVLFRFGADYTKLYSCLADYNDYIQKIFIQYGYSDNVVSQYGSKMLYSLLSFFELLKNDYDIAINDTTNNINSAQSDIEVRAIEIFESIKEQIKYIMASLGEDIYNLIINRPNYKQDFEYYSFMRAKASFEFFLNEDYNSSLKVYETALADARSNSPISVFALLTEYIYVCLENKEISKAVNSAKELISLHDKYKNLESVERKIHTNISLWSVLYSAKEYDACKQVASEYFDCIKSLTDINFDLMSRSERNELITLYGTGGVMLQNLLPHYPSELSGDVYNTLLYEKGLLLRASDRIRNVIYNSEDPQVKTLMDSINAIDSHIKHTGFINYSDYTDLTQMKLASDLTIEKERLEHQVIKMVQSSLPPRESIHDWREIRDVLKSGDIAIEMVCSDSILGALILRNYDNYPIYVPLCEINSLYEPLDSALSLTAFGFSESLYIDDIAHLYDNLLAPIEPLIEGASRIFLSPGGFLNYIAFNAIRLPDSSYIVDHYNIYQLTTTAELLKMHEIRYPDTAVLYGGVYYSGTEPSSYLKSGVSPQAHDDDRGTSGEAFKYLPCTLTELNDIWNNQNSSSGDISKNGSLSVEGWTYHTGFDATEASINELDGNSPSIIHLATHGFYINNTSDFENNKFFSKFKGAKDDALLRSGLALNRANESWKGMNLSEKEDGILTASDLSLLNLSKTSLVVMSACETALGTYSKEGIYGLQRGLKQAGVESILASLWSVNDISTSLFMTEFYKTWLSGKTKQEAMRQAIKATRTKYSSPYYWAPFILLDAI